MAANPHYLFDLAQGASAPRIEQRVLSMVGPVFNEALTIPAFVDRVGQLADSLHKQFNVCLEVIFVDDGSTDGTRALLEQLFSIHGWIKVVGLSRNFGKEIALTAGLRHATGDAVVPIDVDLQDPPEVVIDMVAHWLDGYQVVQGVRMDRSQDSMLKRFTAKRFYSLMGSLSRVRIEPNAGDFQLIARPALNALLDYPETTRFMKGLTACVGFKRTQVHYARAPRSSGSSKFNYWKLWNLALEGITSLSTLPLRVWTYVGVVIALVAIGFAAWTVVRTLLFGVVTPGYASLMAVGLFLGGVQLIGIGVIGEYVGRIAVEVRRRPLFHADLKLGIDKDPSAP